MHPVDEATPPPAPWLWGNGVGGGIGDGSVKIKCLQEAVFISHVFAHILDLRGPVMNL